MLGEPEDHRQLVVAPRGGNRMYNSRHTLIPVIGLPGARGEHPILEEKGLVPREALFKEVSLAGLILPTETVLVQDGVKLFLCL